MTQKLHTKHSPVLAKIGIVSVSLLLSQTAWCIETNLPTGPARLTQQRSQNTINNTSGTQEDKIGELIAQRMNEKPRTTQSSDTLSIGNSLQTLTQRAGELTMHAMGMLGINYKRGGSTPETGLDCSGMVRYVFKQALGRDLPRSAAEMSQVSQTIQEQELQPGDLVFYNTMRRGFSHVGIYLGDNKFIHSPSSGGQVRIESMELAYWKARFNGARRVSE
jgi:cell wall-associated NlpC family hydrolase